MFSDISKAQRVTMLKIPSRSIIAALVVCLIGLGNQHLCDAFLYEDAKEAAQEVAPKLVCYYTSWAADRPVPWSYVSV